MPGNASQSTNRKNQIHNLALRIANSDWIGVLLQGWQLAQKVVSERAVGLYEVLDFDHTLELCDPKGSKAIYRKRETVRLLQDHVATYLDYAWGKGKIFADYRCSPGRAVDRYRYGHRYCTLISLREIKQRGDLLHIRIDRTVRNGFNVKTGWNETVVRHRTRQFRLAVIFPRKRPPKSIVLIQVNRSHTIPLGEANREILPSGRWRVFWETDKPKLFETYILKWTW